MRYEYEYHPENGWKPHICVTTTMSGQKFWKACEDEMEARGRVCFKRMMTDKVGKGEVAPLAKRLAK